MQSAFQDAFSRYITAIPAATPQHGIALDDSEHLETVANVASDVFLDAADTQWRNNKSDVGEHQGTAADTESRRVAVLRLEPENFTEQDIFSADDESE